MVDKLAVTALVLVIVLFLIFIIYVIVNATMGMGGGGGSVGPNYGEVIQGTATSGSDSINTGTTAATLYLSPQLTGPLTLTIQSSGNNIPGKVIQVVNGSTPSGNIPMCTSTGSATILVQGGSGVTIAPGSTVFGGASSLVCPGQSAQFVATAQNAFVRVS